jgi:hypothetical protein
MAFFKHYTPWAYPGGIVGVLGWEWRAFEGEKIASESPTVIPAPIDLSAETSASSLSPQNTAPTILLATISSPAPLLQIKHSMDYPFSA